MNSPFMQAYSQLVQRCVIKKKHPCYRRNGANSTKKMTLEANRGVAFNKVIADVKNVKQKNA
jgi:hypothetical protein